MSFLCGCFRGRDGKTKDKPSVTSSVQLPQNGLSIHQALQHSTNTAAANAEHDTRQALHQQQPQPVLQPTPFAAPTQIGAVSATSDGHGRKHTISSERLASLDAGSICLSEYHSCREAFSESSSPPPSANASPRPSHHGARVTAETEASKLLQESREEFFHSASNSVDSAAQGRVYASPFATNSIQSLSPLPGSLPHAHGHTTSQQTPQDNSIPDEEDSLDEQASVAEPKPHGLVSGCLSLVTTFTTDKDAYDKKVSRRSRKLTAKPDAGCSLKKRDLSQDLTEARECWDIADATSFVVRSVDYMKTKVKVPSAPALYQLVAVDMFSFDKKTQHIAKMVHMPSPPSQRYLNTPETFLPTFLIITIQLPQYAPSLFSSNPDGHGHSFVYYFALPEDFNPATFPNQKALALYRRFVNNGREADGSNTRDRLKILPRIANVEEWMVKGPLSTAEHKLLNTYNDKPVLTRPQHHFHLGQNYLEIDIDIHNYNYLARKALQAFNQRLKDAVWENAFVVQGNSTDELPEIVLGCVRLCKLDFCRTRHFHDFQPKVNISINRSLSAADKLPSKQTPPTNSVTTTVPE